MLMRTSDLCFALCAHFRDWWFTHRIPHVQFADSLGERADWPSEQTAALLVSAACIMNGRLQAPLRFSSAVVLGSWTSQVIAWILWQRGAVDGPFFGRHLCARPSVQPNRL